MTKTKSVSDLAKLEWYNYALSNANEDTKMNENLIKIGISPEALEEGRTLYNNASKAYSDANEARKNAFKEEPQLMEALGLVIKN